MTLMTRLTAAVVVAAGLALWSAGCTVERHPAVPADARMAAEGDGKVSATATEAGMVYISDRHENRLLYSGDIKSGEVVSVDPEANQVTIDGRVVQDKTLH